MALVSTDALSDLTLGAVDNYIKREGTIKADRRSHAWLSWVDSWREYKGFGRTESETLEYDLDSTGTTWSGDATLAAAGSSNNLAQVTYGAFNFTETERYVVDQFQNKGIYLRHPSSMPDPDKRIICQYKGEFQKVKDAWGQKLSTLMRKAENGLALQYLGLKSTASDCEGLFRMFPFEMQGNFAGVSRSNYTWLQHFVMLGATGGSSSENVGPTPTLGGIGTETFFKTLKKCLRKAKAFAGNSGLRKGEWRMLAGGEAMDRLEYQYRQVGIQWQADAARKGNAEAIDVSLGDEDLKFQRIVPWFEPDFEQADNKFASLKPRGVSQLTVTFSGGGSPTRQAKGVAYVSAAGAITAIAITDPGEGYTAFPTLTIGNAGGGTGATFQTYIATTGSGTGILTVQADDNRIGRLTSVTVSAGGSGYAVPTATNFDNLLFFWWEPAWEVLCPTKELDREVVCVPDGRNPNGELQLHHRGMIKCFQPKTVIICAL